MHKKTLIIFALIHITINAQQLNNSQNVFHKTEKNFFIQNKGQWNSEVKYLARIGGMNAWITDFGIIYDYYKIDKNIDESKSSGIPFIRKAMNLKEKKKLENINYTVRGEVVKMQLVNPEKVVIHVDNNRYDGYYNYFIGNDMSKWASFVPLYDTIELQGVYKNIDVKYYYDNGMLRYNYKVKPGADLFQIKFKFEGQEGISINEKGELILKTNIGEVTNGKIFAYQLEGGKQEEVKCKFEQKEDGTIGIKAESYNVEKELIIDPMVYSTFIGGSGVLIGENNDGDIGNSIAIDKSENAYITGYACSFDYPTTSGAYQETITVNNLYTDVFVTKLNKTGSDLVYSTFIGGTGNSCSMGYSIVVDTNGSTYVGGVTNSSNYPTSEDAYQTHFVGNDTTDANVFVTKLNTTGSGLVYSTYIGGSSGSCSIATDASGNAYITGYTTSSNFPTTPRAYQTTNKGNNSFITELNSDGTALIYSSYFGGSGWDNAASIAIDNNGNLYIAGTTSSSDYPVTSGAFKTALDSYTEFSGFVTKLNLTGNGLVYSTYLGGNDYTILSSMAIDSKGNAYITGYTNCLNFPLTPGAYIDTLKVGFLDCYVTKLNSSGSTLIYSTLINEEWGNLLKDIQ